MSLFSMFHKNHTVDVEHVREDLQHRALDAAEEAVAKAHQLAAAVKDEASSAGHNVAHAGSEAVRTLGDAVAEVGATVYDHAPGQGPLKRPMRALGSQLERGGQYLARRTTLQRGAHYIARQTALAVRRYPVQALGLSLGLGLLLGRSSNRPRRSAAAPEVRAAGPKVN
jgi:ElaB/YqjD/DUF883 family membrane-anchored ribosome-binding protein